MEERRKYPRFTKTLPLKLFSFGFDIVTETKNISASGAYCAVNKRIPLMSKLDIILLVPIKKSNKRKIIKRLGCQGIVVRKEGVLDDNNGTGHNNIGIYFNEMKDKDRKILVSYVKSCLSKKP